MFVALCRRHVERYSLAHATLYCSVVAIAFVGSLYCFVPGKIQRLPRDDATHIRWRAMAVSVVCVGAWTSHVYLFCQEWNTTTHVVPMATQVRRSVIATGGVFLHTATLYLGPIVRMVVVVYEIARRQQQQQQQQQEGAMVSVSRFGHVFYAFYVDPTVSSLMRPRNHDSERWTILRNLIVAPITEEIVFRACMVPALHSTGMTAARVSFTAPLFFGFAHGHHALLKLRRNNRGLLPVVLETTFQFAYTSVFGAYVSYAFLRTGSLCAVIVCHVFCNAMGLPDLSFSRIDSPLYPHRRLLMSTLCIGLVGFIAGIVWFDLPPATM